MARNRKLEMCFEVERGNGSVVYVCEFEVTPYDPGRTYGPPEKCYPPEGGDVESKRVFIEVVKPCADHRFDYRGRAGCRVCRKVREERPELEELVDDDELLEYAGDADQDDGPDPDDARDWARERAMED